GDRVYGGGQRRIGRGVALIELVYARRDLVKTGLELPECRGQLRQSRETHRTALGRLAAHGADLRESGGDLVGGRRELGRPLGELRQSAAVLRGAAREL